jgi:hypothetical protein
MVVEALLDGQAEALADKALELALGGDTRMLHALLAMIVPPRKSRPVTFALPKIETASDELRRRAG